MFEKAIAPLKNVITTKATLLSSRTASGLAVHYTSGQTKQQQKKPARDSNRNLKGAGPFCRSMWGFLLTRRYIKKNPLYSFWSRRNILPRSAARNGDRKVIKAAMPGCYGKGTQGSR